MFYVTDIDGSQSPFNSELFRQLRLERLRSARMDSEQSEILRTEALQSDIVNLEIDQVDPQRGGEPLGRPASTENAPRGNASTQPSSPSIGMAGASVQYRPERAKQSTEAVRVDKKVAEVESVPGLYEKAARSFDSPYHQELQESHERKPAIVAAQIMSSPVVTLQAGASLEEAKQLFASRRFRHVPVRSKEGKLVGVLSDRDFLTSRYRLQSGEEVREIMTTNILTARPEARIREVAGVMIRERIGSMPIVGDQGVLEGIITRSDILRTIVNTAPLELWV